MRKMICLQIIGILEAEDSFLTAIEYIWVNDIRENEYAYCLGGCGGYWEVTGQILTKLMQAEGETLQSRDPHTHSCCFEYGTTALIMEPITVPIYKKSHKTDCSHYWGISLINYIQNYIQHPSVQVNLICRWNHWGSSLWIYTSQIN